MGSSSAGPEILAFGSHCSANFPPILDCFIPNFTLNYADSENIKADRVNTAIFDLPQIKQRNFLFGTPGILYTIYRVSHSKVIDKKFDSDLLIILIQNSF